LVSPLATIDFVLNACLKEIVMKKALFAALAMTALGLTFPSFHPRRVLADGPVSDGCLVFNHQGPIAGSGTIIENVNFLSGERLSVTSDHLFYVQIQAPGDVSHQSSTLRAFTYFVTVSGVYTFSIIPASGESITILSTCTAGQTPLPTMPPTPTPVQPPPVTIPPISDGCMVFNHDGLIAGRGFVVQNGSFFKHENLRATSRERFNVEIVTPQGKHLRWPSQRWFEYTLPMAGVYTITIRPVSGQAITVHSTCQPR
jgi:hypothetical protein